MRWNVFTVVLAFCGSLLGAAEAAAEKRVALVIGNSSYKHTPQLANPQNDAADIASLLAKVGFDVVEAMNLDEAGMRQAIRRFAQSLKGSDVGLLYYAGHGLQLNGQNYLVPIDAELDTAEALDFELVRLDVVQRLMERETKTNLIFLDACRDNPLSRNLARAMGTRSSQPGRGLAAVESGIGTLISFSTQPGSVALDGEGRNSPYARALLKHVGEIKEDLSAVLIRVRNDVMAETGDRQIPWEHSALRAKFFFQPPDPPKLASPPGPTYQEAAEFAYWDTVKSSREPVVIQTYIDQFPKGIFVPLARALIDSLKRETEQELISRQREEALKAAQVAKDAAVARDAETKRKLLDARQTDELRRAQAEVRKAQEALKEADNKRLAAEKGAEQARKILETTRLEREKLASKGQPTRSTVQKQVLSREPAAGTLRSGARVLVNDGSCPAGMIKEVIGGSNRVQGTDIRQAGSPRQSRCVAR